MIIKDAISKFGPLADKHFGRVAIRFPSVVPLGHKLERHRYRITRLATPTALLGVRVFPINWVTWGHCDVCFAIRGPPFRGAYNCLALAVLPCRWDNDGYGLKKGLRVQSVVEDFAGLREHCLQKERRDLILLRYPVCQVNAWQSSTLLPISCTIYRYNLLQLG